MRVAPDVGLAAAGLLMAMLYYVVYGGRYSLFRQGPLGLQSLATMNLNSLDSALWYIGTFALLFGLYWLGSRWVKKAKSQLWLIVGGGAILFNVVLLPMLPFDAADIYDYIVRGRMTAVYGLNPMHDPPSQVRTDIAYPNSAWHDVTSAYGPLWETIAAGLARISGDNLLTNVMIFKLFEVLGELLTALLIGLTLRQIAPDRALLAVFLYTWNPIVPFFAAGNGHNDFVMTALIMGSLYCLTRRWFVASTIVAVLGALVKFIPALLLPFIVIVAWRELRGEARIKAFLSMLLLTIVAVVSFYAPYWTGFETLALDRRSHLFTGSVGTLLRQLLEPIIGSDSSATVVSVTAWSAFFLFALIIVVRFWQNVRQNAAVDPLQPIRVLVLLLLFYLLIVVSWFQPWYIVWVLPIALILADTPLRRVTILFSYLVTWQSLIYNYVTVRYDGFAPLPWRDLIPVMVVIGGPVLYSGWLWLRQVKSNKPALESVR